MRLASLWEDLRSARTINVDRNEYVDLCAKVLQQQAEETATGSRSELGTNAGSGRTELPMNQSEDLLSNIEEDKVIDTSKCLHWLRCSSMTIQHQDPGAGHIHTSQSAEVSPDSPTYPWPDLPVSLSGRIANDLLTCLF